MAMISLLKNKERGHHHHHQVFYKTNKKLLPQETCWLYKHKYKMHKLIQNRHLKKERRTLGAGGLKKKHKKKELLMIHQIPDVTH